VFFQIVFSLTAIRKQKSRIFYTMRLSSKKEEPQILSGACGSQFLILSC